MLTTAHHWPMLNELKGKQILDLCTTLWSTESGQPSRYSGGLRAGLPELIPGRNKRFSSSPQLPDRLRPTQPPIQWVLEALSPGVKQPGRETDHSSPSSANIKNSGAILPFSHMSS
jgi:hypothetical protein